MRVCVKLWLSARHVGGLDKRVLSQNNAETERSKNLYGGCQQDRESPSGFTLRERNPGGLGKLHKLFQVVNEKR